MRLLLPLVVTIGFVASPALAQPQVVSTPGMPGLVRYHAGIFHYAPHYNEGFAVGSGAVTIFATNPAVYPAPWYYANPYDPFGPYGGQPVGVWRPRSHYENYGPK
jgi:hypothetical protein